MIDCQIDDKDVKVTLKGIENNGKNMSRAMRTIAVELEESVRENFEVGGRYSVLPHLVKSPYKTHGLNPCLNHRLCLLKKNCCRRHLLLNCEDEQLRGSILNLKQETLSLKRGFLAGRTRLELATSGVTGRCSNQN